MSSTNTQVTYAETDEVVHLELRIIDHNSADDDEKDVDTDYSEGDKVDADDLDAHDGSVSNGLIHDDKRDDKEADEDAEDMYEGLFELFLEHDDNDDEGGDIDMYEELNALFYEPDYIDEVVHRFGEIHEQIMEDHWWYYFGGREVTREMLLEILNQDYRLINFIKHDKHQSISTMERPREKKRMNTLEDLLVGESVMFNSYGAVIGAIAVLPAKRCSLSHEDHDQEFSLLFDLSLTKKKLGLIHDDKRDDKEADEDAED
nr:hypothetical protein [Tanacetum cinerariifolium]